MAPPVEQEAEEVAADAEMKEEEPAAAEGGDAEMAAEGGDADAAAEDAAPAEADGAKDEEKAEADGKDEPEEAAEEPPVEEPEAPKELEEDAPADGRASIKGTVIVNSADSTINMAASCGGKVVMALSDGGFQYLVAGARANAGVKAGRYLYEVRIVESRNPLDHTARTQGTRNPRQVCTLGFSTAGSSLFLGDSEESVGFDSEGNFLCGSNRSRISSRFMPYTQIFGVLLNLDQKSPNANTVSLFRDGVRVCQPKPLPECLKGKVLYPTVNYKNMTLHLNFGPGVLAPLPFRCLTMQEAAAEDVEMVVPKTPSDGRCEVLFPVGLPDEGTFDWLDDFLKRNPDYVELSSRSILEWGLKSGVWRQQQRGNSRNCNDRPNMDFGIRELDDETIRQMIMSIAPILKRNYVVMEVRDGLLELGRKQLLRHFDPADFKRTALVVMGEPPAEYKAKMQQMVLQEKKQTAAAEVKRKREQEERRRPPPPPTRDGKAPEAEEEKEKEKEKEKEPEESLEEAMKKAEEAAELTEEEKSRWFRKPEVEDLIKKELAQHFGKFSIPTKEEGFDEVKYEWQQADASAEYLKVWISERKLTQRVEDLQPGVWFREQYSAWTRTLQDWRKKHSEWRDSSRRQNKQRWGDKEEPKDEKMKDAAAEDGEAEKEKEAGEDGEEKEAPEAPAEDGKTEAKEAPADNSKAEDMDVFAAEDICNVSGGEPLFAHFTWEDWMLLSLRFEIHLMAHAYSRDINDPERTSFHETHLKFYYGRYYNKNFNLQYYGVSSELELLELIKDTIEVTPKNSILDAQLADDTPLENFVRLTEDHRRERQRRIDSGDLTAVLKFQKPPPRGGQQGGAQHGGRSGYQRGPPPPAPHSRGGPPSSRSGPPPSGPPPSRYGPAGGARGGSGAYGGGGSGGYGGSRGGAPPSRYSAPAPAPPPSRSYGGPPPPSSSSYGGGGQKRSYQPASSGGSYPPYKQSRGSGPPPASSRGGSSYGGGSGYSGSGGGYGGGYRR